MKHPVRDRFWVLFCALVALCGAAAAVALVLGTITVDPVVLLLGRISNMSLKVKIALIAAAAVLVIVALRLICVTLPSRKKRASNFALQRNENGMVRISVKALEALVQRCLSQHPEIKVVSSSLVSDEESVRVDVHVALQSDISMPLAISSLQKQIKRYLEACSGVKVEEVRVFVDGALPANANTADSPFAIPASLLGHELLAGTKEDEPLLVAVDEVPAHAAAVEEVVEAPAKPAEETQEPVTEAEAAPAEEAEQAEPAEENPAEAMQEDAGEDA